MQSRFYTYALAQALSEAGEDYVDTFVPFLLAAIPQGKAATDVRSVQGALSEKFSLDVPEAVLGTIATRAKRRGYLEQEARTYRLTEAGEAYRAGLEPEADVSRRVNALLDDVCAFFSAEGRQLTREDAEGLLFDFLGSNVDPLIEFMGGPDRDGGGLETQETDPEQERLLVSYIREAESSKPEYFDTLQQMVLGSLITTMLQTQEPRELIDVRKRKLEPLAVYLDTNYLFSALELHPEELAKPALELFDLLKESGLKPRVFSFTVDEACRVLNGYQIEGQRYPTNVRIDTLYSSLRTRGWTRFQVREYIAHIEEVLQDAGIQVEPVPVNLKTYEAPQTDRVLLARYKSDQPELSQSHDLAAIAQVQKMRGRPVRKFEHCKAFFLTSDNKLTRYCHHELGHAEHGTIAEVVLDRLLTNILWLKNPGIDAPIRMLIAAYSSDLFVKRHIWDRFYETLKKVRASGKATDDQVAALFYRNYVEDLLLGFDGEHQNKITEEFVLREIEAAMEQRGEAEVAKFKAQEREFLQRLGERVDEAERGRDRQWIEKLESIRESVRMAVEKRGRRVAQVAATSGTLAAGAGAAGLYVLADSQNWVDPLQVFLPLVVGGGSIFALWKFLYQAVNKGHVRRNYAKRLKEAGLASPDDETSG